MVCWIGSIKRRSFRGPRLLASTWNAWYAWYPDKNIAVAGRPSGQKRLWKIDQAGSSSNCQYHQKQSGEGERKKGVSEFDEVLPKDGKNLKDSGFVIYVKRRIVSRQIASIQPLDFSVVSAVGDGMDPKQLWEWRKHGSTMWIENAEFMTCELGYVCLVVWLWRHPSPFPPWNIPTKGAIISNWASGEKSAGKVCCLAT